MFNLENISLQAWCKIPKKKKRVVNKMTVIICLLNNYFNKGILVFFFFLRAAPIAYGSFWKILQIRAAAAGLYLHHNHSNLGSGIWASSATYASACSNAISLTHWVRPGINPAFLCVTRHVSLKTPSCPSLLYPIFLPYFIPSSCLEKQ